MRLLADRLARQPATEASPDYNSESKPVNNAEANLETSPEKEDQNAFGLQPRCLLNRPECDITLQSPVVQAQGNATPSPAKRQQPSPSLNVVTTVTPLKKLQDLMNDPGSADYNQISPCLKKMNQQSDKKQINSFSIKKSLVPVPMEGLQKCASSGANRQAMASNLNLNMMNIKQSYETEELSEPNPIGSSQ